MEGTPTLVMISGADEYVPPHLLAAAHDVAARLAAAMGTTARALVIQDAKHALDGAEEVGVSAMSEFMQRLGPGSKCWRSGKAETAA